VRGWDFGRGIDQIIGVHAVSHSSLVTYIPCGVSNIRYLTVARWPGAEQQRIRPVNTVIRAVSAAPPIGSDRFCNIVELAGISGESTSKSIETAIAKLAKTFPHLGCFEADQVRGHIENGRVTHYQVAIRAGFRVAA
jgi:dodecin